VRAGRRAKTAFCGTAATAAQKIAHGQHKQGPASAGICMNLCMNQFNSHTHSHHSQRSPHTDLSALPGIAETPSQSGLSHWPSDQQPLGVGVERGRSRGPSLDRFADVRAFSRPSGRAGRGRLHVQLVRAMGFLSFVSAVRFVYVHSGRGRPPEEVSC
jgi:hypothetical protein